MKNMLFTKMLAICTLFTTFPMVSFAKLKCQMNSTPTSDSDFYICSLKKTDTHETKRIYLEKDLYHHLKANNLIESRETGEGSETGRRTTKARILKDQNWTSQIEN